MLARTLLVGCLLATTHVLLLPAPAEAQPPGRGDFRRDRGGEDRGERGGEDGGRRFGGGRGGRGGEDRGNRGGEDGGRRFGGGRGGWGGRGGDDRGRGGDDGGSRDDRRAGFIRSWDRDGDGYVTKQEVPERMHRFLDRLAAEAGVSSDGRIKIDDLAGASQRDDDEKENPLDFGEPTEEKKAPGFDVSANDAATSGFIPATPEELDGARESSDGLIRRYDENRNGILERDEWTKISGSPANADTNRDGKISRTELINRLIVMRRSRSNDGDSQERNEPNRDDDNRRDRDRAAAKEGGDRRSYRFTTPEERIPEEARSWITGRDKNGDGQVAMHEYATSWTDSRVRDFSRYDGNGDGIVTPDEYLANK